MRIYLAGKVAKQDDEYCEDWRSTYRECLLKNNFSKEKIEIIDPIDRDLDESSYCRKILHY